MDEKINMNNIIRERKISIQSNSSFKQSNRNMNKQIFNNIINSEDLSEDNFKNKTRYLFVKKLNAKEINNSNYYSQAIKNIFSDAKIFLDNCYKGKKVIIGKEVTTSGLKELKELIDKKFSKKRKTYRRNEVRNCWKIMNRTLRSTNNKNLEFSRNNNNSTDTIRYSNTKGKDFMKKYPLSDSELKKIFQEMAEREKKNKNEKIIFSSSSTDVGCNNNNYNKLFNHIKKTKNENVKSLNDQKTKTIKMNINNMLNLQEKILKQRILKKRNHKKLEKKIMSLTFKDDKKKLLMNNKKDLIVIKKKEMDKVYTKLGRLNIQKKYLNNWLSELRMDKCKRKKLNTLQKEIIYYNKDINTPLEVTENNIKLGGDQIKGKESLFKKTVCIDNNNNIMKNISDDYKINNNNIKKYHN